MKINQDALGEAGGVGRVTQFEYEREARSPTVKYLRAIADVGVDLTYVLFARRLETSSLKPEELAAIDKQALKMLVRNEFELGKDMDDESRHKMFEILRSQLIAKKFQANSTTSYQDPFHNR